MLTQDKLRVAISTLTVRADIATMRVARQGESTTISDYDPGETKRQISVNLSLLPCQWKDCKINILDAPGYPDFVAEVKAGLAVSEGAVIVVCAVSGVEVGTEQVWGYASEAQLPCLIFVNKMDRENANFFNALKDIQSKLGKKCLPVQLPIGSQKDFQGVVDLVTKKAYSGTPLKEIELPSSIAGDVDSYRDKLIEAVVEIDDELITKYLDGEEISDEQIYP